MNVRRSTSHRQGHDEREDGSAERLFDREGARCYSLAVHLLGAPSFASEIVERVFAVALRRDPSEQTRARLLSEVHRLCAARLRELPRGLAPAPAETMAWDGIENPAIREVLADMPELSRRTALLVYFAGYRLRELAEALDRSPDELRSALDSAMTTLRRDPRMHHRAAN